MEEKEQQNNKKPGLPEAIHPEIGNGLAWESNPHFAALRSIDPLSALDPYLHDQDSFREQIVQKWLGKENGTPSSQGDAMATKSEKLKGRDKKLHVTPRVEDEKPDWFEHMDDRLLLKDDPHGPVGPGEGGEDVVTPEVKPEGKRVRKAIKKAQKAAKASPPPQIIKIETRQESLSPFTSWLKSLKGSEYVHPFDDDFALEQMAANSKEGISETFADLLAFQGFKDQAIDMYTLLMAKYPEKSSFFAAKIEALK